MRLSNNEIAVRLAKVENALYFHQNGRPTKAGIEAFKRQYGWPNPKAWRQVFGEMKMPESEEIEVVDLLEKKSLESIKKQAELDNPARLENIQREFHKATAERDRLEKEILNTNTEIIV